MTNYYHVLGVSEKATPVEIKAAFKKQAVKYHPDKHPDNPGTEEKLKEVNEAYQVLSDPYEKARYDLKLKYRQFSGSVSASRTHPYQRRPYRKNSTPPQRVNSRQNTIATAYAFAITFGIALLVTTGVWIKKTYDQRQLEKWLAERRAVYAEARLSYEKKDYGSAFELMGTLNVFMAEEQDIKEFKDHMVDDILDIGDHEFRDDNFEEAIRMYELAQKFAPQKPFFDSKMYLVEAYLRTDQPRKSIGILQELVLKEYQPTSSLVRIAEINRDHLRDYEAAKKHYLNAHKIAVELYESFYGEAYSVVINAQHIPQEHYRLYTGLADIYYRLEDYDRTISATDWNKYVWPDSTDAYVISGNAYVATNDVGRACAAFSEARRRGWEETFPITCN